MTCVFPRHDKVQLSMLPSWEESLLLTKFFGETDGIKEKDLSLAANREAGKGYQRHGGIRTLLQAPLVAT